MALSALYMAPSLDLKILYSLLSPSVKTHTKLELSIFILTSFLNCVYIIHLLRRVCQLLVVFCPDYYTAPELEENGRRLPVSLLCYLTVPTMRNGNATIPIFSFFLSFRIMEAKISDSISASSSAVCASSKSRLREMKRYATSALVL